MKWLILLLLVLTGCKSIQYVPVETTRTDSVYISKIVRDSTIVRDSIFVRAAHDTIYEYRYKYIYKNNIVRDTVSVERTDTIRIPYPVEKKLSRWQQIKLDISNVLITAVCFVLLVYFGRFVCKRRR